jgi:hypothetical protein
VQALCGKGFPAATIQAESLSRKKNLPADNLIPEVMDHYLAKRWPGSVSTQQTNIKHKINIPTAAAQN